MSKTISFRATEDEVIIIQQYKDLEEGRIRKITDTMVIKEALRLLSETFPKESQVVVDEIGKEIISEEPHPIYEGIN